MARATGKCAPIHPQLGASGQHKAAMATKDIAAAVQRVESVLKRRPAAGIHDDAPATARWQTGMRVVASHANGTQMLTDMPTELGGSGDQVTPGWLFRAGLASCCATRIAMGAAAAGIELAMLEVLASSRSDTRGLFGMADARANPWALGLAMCDCSSESRRPGSPRSDCGPWSKIAIAVHRYPQPCGTPCPSPCRSKWTARNGCAV
jgi:hypothetical protein